MRVLAKDWDRHVLHAEEIARGSGFRALRDAIIRSAEPRAGDRAIDIGSGTGLLTLALARRVATVWALDISPAMCEYLRVKAASADLDNVEPVVGSAISLPLVDASTDLVVSNYCFHHLNDEDKRRALSEVRRVLAPGGRLVFADMMFRPTLTNARDRDVVATKVRSMLRKGGPGVFRLAKNAGRFVTASWEKPARPEWWASALEDEGFTDVAVEALRHEGGLAVAKLS